jgi:uncharacterized protein (DUF4415 family)
MSGLNMNSMDVKVVLAAVKNPPPGSDFLWDGLDEDDRPATEQEMRAAVATYKKRGRPVGSGTKEQVAIRFDRDVLLAFRNAGPGWQTRMNDALRDWLLSHSPETLGP